MPKAKSNTHHETLVIRVPVDVYQLLSALSAKSGRSIGAEIRHALLARETNQ